MITPQDVKDYTVFQSVKERLDAHLCMDIVEATNEIRDIVGHDFSGDEYKPLPDDAKLAFVKMAQFFALTNTNETIYKGFASESLSKYSYTLNADGSLRKPDIYPLVKSYIKVSGKKGNTRLRMRVI